MTSLVHDTTNDNRLSDFNAQVRELGRDAAAGKDSLPNLAMAFARAVVDGVIDPAKDASGKDGAARVFDLYAQAEGKKAVHDRTEGGLKANVSKLRQIQNAASNPKWDFVDVLNRAHTIRQDYKRCEIDVKPAYAAFVDVAREQQKFDDALTDMQIADVVKKGESSKEVTLEGELKRIQKKVEKIITGELKDHTGAPLKDQSPELIQVQELINQRLAALMTTKQDEEDEAKLAEIMARRAQRAPLTIEAHAA
jgi:hypothetical protein